MQKYLWSAIAGLFLCVLQNGVTYGAGLAGFSHDEALVHSQAVIGNTLSDIQLRAVDGSPVSVEAFRGRPLVISLIFTSCHHICPATTRHLGEVVDKARSVLGQDSFQVLTVGFDVANDTPERMGIFEHRNAVNDENWAFLAGDEGAIASLTEQLGFIYAPSSRGFDHLIQSSIIDAQGKVYRQVYGITFPTKHLIEPLKQLVFGEPRSASTLDYLENRIRLFCTVYDPATDTYHIDISVFIGTFVGLVVSIIFGSVLVREWRRSIKADQ